MKNIVITISLFFILISFNLEGQNVRRFQDMSNDITIEERLKIANELYTQQRYYTAIDFYQKALEEDEINNEANYKLAQIHYLLRDFKQANHFFEKLISLNTAEYPVIQYQYGISLKATGSYEEAITAFKTFIKSNPEGEKDKVKTAEWELESCQLALKSRENAGDVAISILDPSNQQASTKFGAVKSPDQNIVFTGVHTINKPKKQTIGETKGVYDVLYANRIYEVKSNEVNFEAIEELKIKLTSENQSIGSPFFTENGDRIYYTICQENNINCQVYYSNKKSNGKWSDPVKMPGPVNADNSETKNLVIGVDDFNRKLMFYSSDREGGEGGFDIWYSILNEQGEAQEAINLGPALNTKEQEITPFFDSQTNLLFFSSNGHKGLGELDVYMVAMDFESRQGKIYNLGLPINSSVDDYYFNLHNGGQAGFITSNRIGSVAANQNSSIDNLYEMSFNEPFTYKNLPDYLAEVQSFDENDVAYKLFDEAFDYKDLANTTDVASKINVDDITIDGSVFDNNSEAGNKTVYLLDDNNQVIDSTVTDNSGKFQFKKLPGDNNYSIAMDGGDDISANMKFFDGEGKELLSVNSKDDSNYFSYKKLDDKSGVSPQMDEDDVYISGSLLTDNQPAVNKKVILTDENGNMIDGAYTDKDGNFKFQNLPYSSKYVLKMENGENLSANMDFFDQNDNLLLSTNSEDNKTNFDYQKLNDVAITQQKIAEEDTAMILENDDHPEATAPSPGKQLKNIFKWAMSYDDYQDLIAEHGKDLQKDINLRVQIGAYTTPPETLFKNLGLGEIDLINSKGLTKFLIGNFTELNQAEVLRKQAFDKGISDAFVSVYYKGKRVAILIYDDKNKMVRKYEESNN